MKTPIIMRVCAPLCIIALAGGGVMAQDQMPETKPAAPPPEGMPPPAAPEAPPAPTPDVSPPPEAAAPEAMSSEAAPAAPPAAPTPPAPPAAPAETTYQKSDAPVVSEAAKDYPACTATLRDQCTNAGKATKKKARKRG